MNYSLRLFGLATLLFYVNATVRDRARLKSSLLDGYRRDTRPVHADNTRTNVTLMLALRQIIDMDMRNEIISARMYIYMRWTDELLSWNASAYGGIESIHLYAQSIWTPDIIMYNEIHEKGYLKEMVLKRLRVYHTGLVHWPSPITAVTSCPLNMKHFPWDEQLCSWQLGSWVYPLLEVDLLPQSDPNEFTINYVEHGEWELVESFSKREMSYEGVGGGDSWPTVTFSVRLKRRPLFFLVNLIMPSILIAVLSLLAFCVPTEEGEKITVSITVLLASTVFLLVVNDIMPVQSYTVPIISEFYLSVLVCLGLAAIATVFVSCVHHRGCAGQDMTPRVQRVTNTLAKLVCMTHQKSHICKSEDNAHFKRNDWRFLAKCLDRLFIVIFTLLFLICFTLILA